MTASTTITCTKSEFRANLRNHYATGVVIDKTQADELDEVIDGLVLQANGHRGTFEGYSAYLDCDFIVTPDETKCADCDAPGVRMDHGDCGPGSDFSVKLRCERHSRPDKTDEITIPTVASAQRAQSADAAQSTVLGACQALATIASTLFGHDTDAEMVEALAADLHALADRLGAAAGHLRIANGQG